MKKDLARSRLEAEENKRLTGEAARQQGPEILDAKRELREARAESEILRSKLNDEIEEVKAKDIRIHSLSEQLAQMDEENKGHAGQARLKSEESGRQLNERTEELKSKEEQIQKLNEQLARRDSEYKEFEERAAGLKKIESDILWFEEVLNEQKRDSGRMKQRIEESRMKMQLLNEKTKENVELIARFAEGKEFDEFRRLIHLDEIIQKYENQIRDLRIRNMELEKKLRTGGGGQVIDIT